MKLLMLTTTQCACGEKRSRNLCAKCSGEIALPKTFFDDHADRLLPTPNVIRTRARQYVVRADDPALAELLDDARHYAHSGLDAAPADVVAFAIESQR